MGKAKRKLMAARAACYEKVNDNPDLGPDIALQKFHQEQNENYDMDTASILAERIREYVTDYSYDLAEYLDVRNLHSYLLWVLQKR